MAYLTESEVRARASRVTQRVQKTAGRMPWELGYFDGHNGRVGIIPVTRAQEETFKGEEYLSLYPYVDQVRIQGGGEKLWINRTVTEYAGLYEWIKGTQEIYKH